MKFSGHNLSTGRRHPNGKVILTFGERWSAEDISRRALEIQEERRKGTMRVLERTYGQGRGRQAVESDFDLSALRDHFGVDDDAAMMARVVALGSPYIILAKGEEWTGTPSGAKKKIGELAEGLGFRLSAAKSDNPKTEIVVTFRSAE